jgi:hypothetical protein
MQSTRFNSLAALILLASFVFSGVPAGAQSSSAGIDIAGMDKSVNPGDDFFGYTNGGWSRTLGGRPSSHDRWAACCPIIYNALEAYKHLMGYPPHRHHAPRAA